jgi:hypothetical protein
MRNLSLLSLTRISSSYGTICGTAIDLDHAVLYVAHETFSASQLDVVVCKVVLNDQESGDLVSVCDNRNPRCRDFWEVHRVFCPCILGCSFVHLISQHKFHRLRPSGHFPQFMNLTLAPSRKL